MAKAKGRATKPEIGFVLDNSIVMAWSFEDESDEYADAVLDRLATTSALAPAPAPPLVRNAACCGSPHAGRAAGRWRRSAHPPWGWQTLPSYPWRSAHPIAPPIPDRLPGYAPQTRWIIGFAMLPNPASSCRLA